VGPGPAPRASALTAADVNVIGGGAAGSATAWWLARRGVGVTLLERFASGHDRGSSHGASRIFRFAYADPYYVRLAQASLPMWRELEDDAGEPLLDTTGAVDHGDPSSIADTIAALVACDAPHEVVSAADAAERWPFMRCEGAVLFHPAGGRCRADATVAALQRRAEAHGAVVHHSAGAVTLSDDLEVVAPALERSWRAKVVVVTAGAWTESVVGRRVALPALTVTQEQVQHFTPRFTSATPWPSFIHHQQPWVYGLISPGEGMKVARHHVGPVVDPDERPARDAAADGVVSQYVERWFPGLDPTPVHTAECLYTTTPDEAFVLERSGSLVVGSACSGHGFKFTPLVGQRLADLALSAL
jgi:sarcosine oxidase